MFALMKRISFLIVVLTLWTAPGLRAQDAATEERLNKLSGRLEDLAAAQDAIRSQVQALAKEIDGLREQLNKPSPNYAAQEDVRRLADAVKEIDRKRLEGYDKIHAELLHLGHVVTSGVGTSPRTSPKLDESTSNDKPQQGYEYVIQKGDNLSSIAQAYQEKNIKVSVEQILKANPGLSANKLIVGKKIFIPAAK